MMRSTGDELDALREAGLYRETRSLNPGPGGTIRDARGNRLANFSSNDYLGLAGCPILREAMADAARDFGAGAGASRLISGTHSAHVALEDRLAQFKKTPAALAFSSGFTAALGVLTAMLQRGDTVILDKLCHASLVDGARLSGATLRVFPHNHLGKLERILRATREKSPADARVLLVTESVFSMDGDHAALPEIVDLKERYGALLLLDEAHGFGILGKGGRGLADELGLASRIDLHLGTLSKAAGVSGGFIAADRPTIDLLTNRSRSFIYTTAPPPAIAATATRAIDLLESEEGDVRRDRLWSNLDLFARECGSSIRPPSAIVPRIIGGEREAMAVASRLRDAGFFVPAVRFPTVAKGSARLRITFSADHSPAQIQALASHLRGADVGGEIGG